MTVKEVIETVDALRPNEIAAEDKRKWLYELESRIYEDLYVTHEHEGIGFTDTEKILSDGTTELFIKAPHDEIYILYLCSLIDFTMQSMRDMPMTMLCLRLCMKAAAVSGTAGIFRA